MNHNDDISNLLKDDVLYKLIEERMELKETLMTDEYLESINRNKYYSPTEISSWFGVTDGQIRYYIKPFFDYIFLDDEDTPLSEKTLRLGFKSILKIRMILLLKDEFKVNGLKHVLMDTPRIVRKSSTDISKQSNDDENIMLVLQQIMNSGLFNHSENTNELELNPTLKALLDSNNDYKSILEKIQLANDELNEKIEANNKILLTTENHHEGIQSILIDDAELQIAAEKAYQEKYKYGPLARLFKHDQIELEKKQFIFNYIKTKKDA